MATEQVTIKVNEETFNRIKEFYSSFMIEAKGDYVDFLAVYGDILITGYSSKKTKKSIIFKGKNASLEAEEWIEKEEDVEQKEKIHIVDYGEQIGSDEVGVGDFYLPMIVVAAYMRKDQYQRLKEL